MQFSVRVAYPEDKEYNWYQSVQTYEQVASVEVAFFNPELFLENVAIHQVREPFEKLTVKTSSIHMAQFSLTNLKLFEDIFYKTIDIAKLLSCDSIVIHPSMGKFERIKDFVENIINPTLTQEKIYLCWETFGSRRRIFGGFEKLLEFCKVAEYHRICFDFSHIHKEQREILEDLELYLDLIRIFHVSNRAKEGLKQHCPIFYNKEEMAIDFDEIFQFLKDRNFKGYLILEYLPEFHSNLLLDALTLIKKYQK